MQATTTIQAEIESFIFKEGLTITQFAELTGINSGTISSILNGRRSVAVGQLDRITAAMGRSEGSYYDLYVDECLVHSSPNWRRLGPFLMRCAELDKLEYIKRTVHLLMDNLSYAPMVFEVAERLFKDNKWTSAAILYESVAESERYQHSERLALCQYRLFKIALSEDQDANLRAAVKFEPYVERLDEIDQLDALKDLVNTYSALRIWDKMDKTAEEMGRKAEIQYSRKHSSERKNKPFREPSIPIFCYVLYSNLMRGVVCEEYGQYEQALHYVSLYSNMDWVKENDDEALFFKQKFRVWATANEFVSRLMAGEIRVLQDYVDYITPMENEIFKALFRIIEAANRYQIDIDEILKYFEQQIAAACITGPKSSYKKQVMDNRFAHFLSDLAIYHLNKQRYMIGIKWVLESLAYALKTNNDICIIRCVGLFEQFRRVASEEQQKQYHKLIGEVQLQNEKKISFVNRSN
nr:helix-turn-helix transcriptional regulator [Paenibacillus caui]